MLSQKIWLPFTLLLIVFFFSGCGLSGNGINSEKQNIKGLSLEKEWNQIIASAGRTLNNPSLNRIHILMDSKGDLALLSWQWIEKDPDTGQKRLYLTQKNSGRYKILEGEDAVTEASGLVPLDTMVSVIDKYGLDMIFREIKSADLMLQPALTPKFSLKDADHILVQNGKQIDPNMIKSDNVYVYGIFGQDNTEEREYMFSLD